MLLGAILGQALGLGDPLSTPRWVDPRKVVKIERCGHCHESEFRVWQDSEHARMFKTLEARPSAIEIGRRMGAASIKRNSVCLDCHYTPSMSASGDVEAVAGVSCQSCHGAAKDWIEVHGNYGGGLSTYKTETPEHRQQRIDTAKNNGMFRPSNLYDVVQNCYRCHTVPQEALVNRGEHGSGSPMILTESFEKISHNYLQSFLQGDGAKERKLTAEEKRVMWVVGWGLDLEYSYRGVANATTEGVFLQAMERRARDARGRLNDLRLVANIPRVDSMLAIAAAAPIAPNRARDALAAAEGIARQNRAFVDLQGGSALGAVDTLIGGWRPLSSEVTNAETALDSAAADAPQLHVVGQAVAHVDPSVPPHKAIGVAACSKCHGRSAGWWRSDRHANAANVIFQSTRRASQIAQHYGLAAAEMRSADRLCMDCHAGRGAASLQDGVACEACHGPGMDYKEPHQHGEKSLALERPGYKKALTLGMVDLRRAAPMARACARCHYITQERLLSSGHPSGAKFDLAASHARIQHWTTTAASDGDLKQAYAAEVQKRGPIPGVAAVPSSNGASADGAEGPAGGAPDMTIAPFVELPANATIEEILTAVRQRLRELHRVSRPR
jgi:hypothetical protein